jgi:hypothetical protein
MQYSVYKLVRDGNSFMMRSSNGERVDIELAKVGKFGPNNQLATIRILDVPTTRMGFVHFKQDEYGFRMQNMCTISSTGLLCEFEHDGGCGRPFHDQNPLSVPKSVWGSNFLFSHTGAFPRSESGFVFVVPINVIDIDSVVVTNGRICGRIVSDGDMAAIHSDWFGSVFRFDEFDSVDHVRKYLNDPQTKHVCICLSQDGERIKTVSAYYERYRNVDSPKPILFEIAASETVEEAASETVEEAASESVFELTA